MQNGLYAMHPKDPTLPKQYNIQFVTSVKENLEFKKTWNSWENDNNKESNWPGRSTQLHGIEEVFASQYSPKTDEEQQLFQEKQMFSYSVLMRFVPTDIGRTIVGEHKDDCDAQVVIEANNVLSNHRFDNSMKIREKNHSQNKKEDKNGDITPPLSFAQLKGRCYYCGRLGNKSPECSQKDWISKADGYINKFNHQHPQQTTDEESTTKTTLTSSEATTNSKEAGYVGWTGIHYSFAQPCEMKDFVLLDSGLTDAVFCNPEYVKKIRDDRTPLKRLWSAFISPPNAII